MHNKYRIAHKCLQLYLESPFKFYVPVSRLDALRNDVRNTVGVESKSEEHGINASAFSSSHRTDLEIMYMSIILQFSPLSR